MPRPNRTPSYRLLRQLLAGVLILAVTWPAMAGHRQFRNNNVGGVSIDPEGVVRGPSDAGRKMLLNELRKDLDKVGPELNLPVELRKISLKRLHAAIEDALKEGVGRLPDEIRYMAGLQRIQFIFVYPEENDIVLAGPGEGWKVDKDANIVGVTTGRPVLLLDDFLVALRQVQEARNIGISCSIDPTDEGYQRLNRLLDAQKSVRGPRNIPALEKAMVEAFGPQQVKIKGVPPQSHFGRVLLAADYRMKRLGMNLDPSPVAGFPSYVSLIKNSSETASNPRWWLACNYEPVARSEDGMAWEIRGPGVKALTEDEFVSPEGKVSGTGRTSPAAKKWADLMTEKYDALAGKDKIFGELRNIMDMSVVAALIAHHDLLKQAGCELPLMYKKDGELMTEAWHAPKSITPQCSFLRTRKGWIVTASGGVQVESWQVAARTQSDARVGEVRNQAQASEAKSWWWN